MTKPRLTQDEHIELGAALDSVYRELHRRTVQLANAYPRTGPEARPMKLLDDAIEDLNKARYALENLCFDEHPKTAATTNYFPH